MRSVVMGFSRSPDERRGVPQGRARRSRNSRRTKPIDEAVWKKLEPRSITSRADYVPGRIMTRCGDPDSTSSIGIRRQGKPALLHRHAAGRLRRDHLLPRATATQTSSAKAGNNNGGNGAGKIWHRIIIEKPSAGPGQREVT